MRSVAEDGFVGYRSPALDDLSVPHLFTTRLGGSLGEFDLTRIEGAVAERLALVAGRPGARILRTRQVHGRTVLDADRADADVLAAADALLLTRADRLVAARAADCVPILLAGPGGTRVAAVHAGWRGLVADVLGAALEALGPCTAAAVGPCIGSARYEVGPEVVQAFREAELTDALAALPEGRARVDLRKAATLRLARAGVPHIDVSDRCAFDDREEFFSHRRDVTAGGKTATGRMAGVIGVAAAISPAGG